MNFYLRNNLIIVPKKEEAGQADSEISFQNDDIGFCFYLHSYIKKWI